MAEAHPPSSTLNMPQDILDASAALRHDLVPVKSSAAYDKVLSAFEEFRANKFPHLSLDQRPLNDNIVEAFYHHLKNKPLPDGTKYKAPTLFSKMSALKTVCAQQPHHTHHLSKLSVLPAAARANTNPRHALFKKKIACFKSKKLASKLICKLITTLCSLHFILEALFPVRIFQRSPLLGSLHRSF